MTTQAVIEHDGWKPAPKVPTDEMVMAGLTAGHFDARERHFLGAAYRAMIDATPPAPAARPDKTQELRDLLREVADKGLIYWEPNTSRGHVAKADMLRRIEAALVEEKK